MKIECKVTVSFCVVCFLVVLTVTRLRDPLVGIQTARPAPRIALHSILGQQGDAALSSDTFLPGAYFCGPGVRDGAGARIRNPAVHIRD